MRSAILVVGRVVICRRMLLIVFLSCCTFRHITRRSVWRSSISDRALCEHDIHAAWVEKPLFMSPCKARESKSPHDEVKVPHPIPLVDNICHRTVPLALHMRAQRLTGNESYPYLVSAPLTLPFFS